MVRSLVMRVRCDLCRTAATHVGLDIKIGSRRRRSIDLCDLHYETLVRPVIDALEQHGYDPSRPLSQSRQSHHRTVGPYLCKAGCLSSPLKNSTTFTQHLRGMHGMTMADYVEKYGEPVPLTTEQLADLDVELTCPEGCGQIYSTARGNRYPQIAMQSHMWGHHGIKWKQPVENERKQ